MRLSVFSRAAAAVMVLAFVLNAGAQVVVPNGYDNVPGTGTFLGPLTVGPRTYQLLIDSSQLTSLLGQEIDSVTWRLLPSASADWPAAQVSYTSFDIYLGQSVDPSARSLTFANNAVGPQTQVRSGPLTIPAGSFKSGSSPNQFGMEIVFNTPYLYTGNDLLLELRHTGHGAASSAVDALTTSTSGYGTLFSAAWQSSYTATSGSQGNAIITQFGVVPEPGVASIVLAGMMLLSRRRVG